MGFITNKILSQKELFSSHTGTFIKIIIKKLYMLELTKIIFNIGSQIFDFQTKTLRMT